MKICVFSPRTTMPVMVPLVAVTDPYKRRYCKRHGYDYLTPTLPGDRCNEEEKYGFKRLALIIELLKADRYDWVWVVGCDVLITNPSIKLESLIDDDFGMVVGTEPGGVGMDSFLIRKAKGGLELMEKLITYKDHPIGGAHEQSTLDSIRQDPEIAKVIKVLPQRRMNSYKYATLHQYAFIHPGFVSGTDWLGNSGEWQPGDFVLHTPGLPQEEQKVKIFSEVIPLIEEYPLAQPQRESVALRLIDFYRRTKSKNDANLGPIWGNITSTYHKPVADALSQDDPKVLLSLMDQLAPSSILGGIETLVPISRPSLDSWITGLAQKVGVLPVPNPEQASPTQNWQLRDLNTTLNQIESALGFPMSLPQCFGFSGMLMPFRFIYYCAAAFTINCRLPNWGHVLEIGAGLGNLGFIAYHKQALSYTVIDLPTVAVMSAFFMSKVCQDTGIWLYGEPAIQGPFARFYPASDYLGARDRKYSLIFNSDSLPEMPNEIQDSYLDLIANQLDPNGIFLSINHESDAQGQRSVLESVRRHGKLRLESRCPFMLRAGYMEEVYRLI